MTETKEKKVLLSLKNVDVKFNVRGRILSAIRNVSLDIYENESIAIVGESGSGKSVLTKTFAGMLDSNGYISGGSIIFSDDEISETSVTLNGHNSRMLKYINNMLNRNSRLERGAAEYVAYKQKLHDIDVAKSIPEADQTAYEKKIKELDDDIIDRTNYLWTLDKKNATTKRKLPRSMP